jgi:hypothetical protein
VVYLTLQLLIACCILNDIDRLTARPTTLVNLLVSLQSECVILLQVSHQGMDYHSPTAHTTATAAESLQEAADIVQYNRGLSHKSNAYWHVSINSPIIGPMIESLSPDVAPAAAAAAAVGVHGPAQP